MIPDSAELDYPRPAIRAARRVVSRADSAFASRSWDIPRHFT
jgi:hypothetical protein